MPETDNNKRGNGTQCRAAGERDYRCIDIIAAPACQGNMPAAPVVGDILLQIGPVEILHHAKTQQSREAYRNIGESRELKIKAEPATHHFQVGNQYRMLGIDALNVVTQSGIDQKVAKKCDFYIEAAGINLWIIMPKSGLIWQTWNLKKEMQGNP